ncbi:hypothetical protein DAI22_01g452150 [Oryza sativa Japonica Group]|nr:hypothetical protein DAI22_01g452150 [Oryza sativa Japonica Group]
MRQHVVGRGQVNPAMPHCHLDRRRTAARSASALCLMRLSTKTRRQREGDARRHCRRRKVAAACRFIFSERLAGHPWGERMGGDGRNAGSDLHAPPIRMR